MKGEHIIDMNLNIFFANIPYAMHSNMIGTYVESFDSLIILLR
jgi:hypothetical protein